MNNVIQDVDNVNKLILFIFRSNKQTNKQNSKENYIFVSYPFPKKCRQVSMNWLKLYFQNKTKIKWQKSWTILYLIFVEYRFFPSSYYFHFFVCLSNWIEPKQYCWRRNSGRMTHIAVSAKHKFRYYIVILLFFFRFYSRDFVHCVWTFFFLFFFGIKIKTLYSNMCTKKALWYWKGPMGWIKKQNK